jgi:SPP1 family predicted phage head-tail adaptor
MRAGPLRHQCSVQKQTRIPDGTGGYEEGWTEIRSIWAEITIPSGRTSVVAQQVASLITVEIRVRPAADVLPGVRLVNSGVTYLVEAVLPDNERSMLRLLCSNVANP